METREVVKEVTIVKKGFFWLAWTVLKFPFIMLWKLFKFIFRYLNKYHLLYMENRKIEKRTKQINRFFVISRKNEERL